MSWLDDMEAADPAYPGPGQDDLWAPPGRVARGDREAAGRWPQQQKARAPVADARARMFTPGEAYQAAEYAIGLFLEYRDVHGRAEGEARVEALGEVAQGLHLRGVVASQALNRDRPVGPDWRALRESEAAARDAGLRASMLSPDGPRSPGYQADAEAWGTGRGIGPDGPGPGGLEAGE